MHREIRFGSNGDELNRRLIERLRTIEPHTAERVLTYVRPQDAASLVPRARMVFADQVPEL